MTVYLLYSANTWLESSSMELLMVCDSEETAIKNAIGIAKDWGEELTEEDVDSLELHGQTQCRNTNFIISGCMINERI